MLGFDLGLRLDLRLGLEICLGLGVWLGVEISFGLFEHYLNISLDEFNWMISLNI